MTERHTCKGCHWLRYHTNIRSPGEGGGSWKSEVCHSPEEKRFDPMEGWVQESGDIWVKNKEGFCGEWEAR